MIKKEIKQYKRGKTGYVQRIDFNKKDNLKEGQIIYISTEKELKNIEQTSKINKEYSIELEEKDKSIKDLTKQLNNTIEDKNSYNYKLIALRIIIFFCYVLFTIIILLVNH